MKLTFVTLMDIFIGIKKQIFLAFLRDYPKVTEEDLKGV